MESNRTYNYNFWDFNFVPLRIRAYLQTPVVTSDTYLPLDAAIYSVMVRDAVGDDRFISLANENTVKEGKHINLPFKKNRARSECWFYCCSFAQWPDHAVDGNEAYVKKFDTIHSDFIEFGKRKATVDISRGHYKAVHRKLYYRSALYIDWYALGDKDIIIDLLRFVTNLGKKTAQGWGAVLRWEVIDWHEDWSIRGPKNQRGQQKLMRALPMERSSVVCGLRPSYWLPRHQFQSVIPHPSGDGTVIT